MRQYETTFVINPTLSGDEIKQTAEMYLDHLRNSGCEIVHVTEWGMRPLAYPIKKCSTGAYFIVEYKTASYEAIDKMELSFRRDDHILRFLTIKLDKYAIKYNDDKRNGLIGKKKEEKVEEGAKA
ncbi:MAG: 30S ribosomal protein S6 [Saprospiraceae bacterium]|nr:30S ribosomal protein S6 [Saprospiraceae bacterium]